MLINLSAYRVYIWDWVFLAYLSVWQHAPYVNVSFTLVCGAQNHSHGRAILPQNVLKRAPLLGHHKEAIRAFKRPTSQAINDKCLNTHNTRSLSKLHAQGGSFIYVHHICFLTCKWCVVVDACKACEWFWSVVAGKGVGRTPRRPC